MAALLALLAVVLVAGSGGSKPVRASGGGVVPAAAEQPPTQVASSDLDPRLREAFAVFREERPSTAGELSANAAGAIERLARTQGADTQLTRRGASGPAGVAYLTPTADALCLTVAESAGAGGGCAPIDVALSGGFVGTTYLDEGVLVRGVVPDDVTAVTIVLEDGRHAPARIEGNSYLELVSAPPATLLVAAGDDERRFPIPH